MVKHNKKHRKTCHFCHKRVNLRITKLKNKIIVKCPNCLQEHIKNFRKLPNKNKPKRLNIKPINK